MQIYQIYNKNTGKSYVGKAVDYVLRYEVHKRNAANHMHRRLYHSMNSHGIDAFELRMLEDLGEGQTRKSRREKYSGYQR